MNRAIVSMLGVLSFVGVLPDTAGNAGAQSACLSRKLKAMGSVESALFRCSAKAAAAGVNPYQCQAKALEKFGAALAKADTAGPCPTGACQCLASRCLDAVNNELPDVGPSTCKAKRLKAAGSKARGIFQCNAKAAASNIPVDAACVQRAKERFAAAFAKTSGCTGSQESVEARVDGECVGDVGGDSAGGAFVGTLCGPPGPECFGAYSGCGNCSGSLGGMCLVAAGFENLGDCALVCFDTGTISTLGCTSDSDCPSGQLCSASKIPFGPDHFCAAPCTGL